VVEGKPERFRGDDTAEDGNRERLDVRRLRKRPIELSPRLRNVFRRRRAGPEREDGARPGDSASWWRRRKARASA
jgi:hypothetical protein